MLMGVAAHGVAGLIASPEIDPSAGVAAVVLLSGGLMVLRARRRRQ